MIERPSSASSSPVARRATYPGRSPSESADDVPRPTRTKGCAVAFSIVRRVRSSASRARHLLRQALICSLSVGLCLSCTGSTAAHRSGSPSTPRPSRVGSPPPSIIESPVPASISGTWEFETLTGVPPSLLPKGAVRDNRRDIVIREDGSFRWGHWAGSVERSGPEFFMFVTRPETLRRRFEDFDARVVLVRVRNTLKVWLPDLGQDRDIDYGQATEDIDSPDMLFRRASR